MSEKHVKVLFLDRGRDPETAWCTPVGRARYRLDNILVLHSAPVFGDVIEAKLVDDVLTYTRVTKAGGRYTLILAYPDVPTFKKLTAFLRKTFDAECEGAFEGTVYVAVDKKFKPRDVFAAAESQLPGIAAVHPFKKGKASFVAPPQPQAPASLFDAVRGGNTALVEEMVAAGAELNPAKKHPLYAAALRNRAKEAKLLIAAGSDPRRAKDKDGDPVLVTAAFRDSRAALRAFLTVPHAEDVKSLALLEAAGSGYLDAAKLLVKHGADPTWKSSKGNSAVSIARKKKKTELVAYFKSLAE